MANFKMKARLLTANTPHTWPNAQEQSLPLTTKTRHTFSIKDTLNNSGKVTFTAVMADGAHQHVILTRGAGPETINLSSVEKWISEADAAGMEVFIHSQD